MLIKLSGWWTDLRGKNGGSCVSKNAYGLYWKNWKKPKNPKTPYQIAVRTNWKTLLTLWTEITDQQRIDWNKLGKSITNKTKVGVNYHPSGFDVFMSCNQNRYSIGESSLQDAPTVPTIQQYTKVSWYNTPSQAKMGWQLGPWGSTPGVRHLLSITKSFSPGRFQMSFNFAMFDYVNDGSNTTSLTYSDYFSRMGLNFTNGKKYFYKFKPIHIATGFAGLELKGDFIFANGNWIIGISQLGINTNLA